MQSTRAAPVGFQQLTALSSAARPAVPAGANFAIFTVETQSVRFQDDGVAPTNSIRIVLSPGAGAPFEYWGNLGTLQFIQVAPSAILDVAYYRVAG